MKKNSITKLVFIFLVVGIFGYVSYLYFTPSPIQEKQITSSSTPTVIANAEYLCDANHTITAIFKTSNKPIDPITPNSPPTPNGLVTLSFDTEPEITLAQTISADGGRYANENESLIFWDKGTEALVLQNGAENMFTNCIKIAKDTDGLPQIYKNNTYGFSLRYPNEYVIDDTYTYTELSPQTQIHGVKFIIPNTLSEGTNLSSDTYISVEETDATSTCTASLFLPSSFGVESVSIEEQGTSYSFASSTDAGAGNRYEEYVYAIPGTTPCKAVRYFIHYSVLENYDPGTIHAYDAEALLSTFAKIRDSLILNPNLVPTV